MVPKRSRRQPTFRTVWATLDRAALRQEEADKRFNERLDRMALRQEEIQKSLGQLSNRLGQIVEHLMAPNLKEKFAAFGYCFSQMAADLYINDARHGIALEIDAFLENGDCAIAVEIKVKPGIDDVNRHIKRMEKLRTYAGTRNDRRQFYGAVAGTVITQMVKDYVLDQGLYLIEPSGEDVVVVPPHGPPKAWQAQWPEQAKGN